MEIRSPWEDIITLLGKRFFQVHFFWEESTPCTYYKKFWSFLGKWFKTHSTTLDNLDFFIVASQRGDSDNCGVSNHLLWLWVWKKIIIESWILHIRLSTMRNFGPFWENDLRHTPQLFGILIFLLLHYKVVIMIIVEFPIICFDFGCGKK